MRAFVFKSLCQGVGRDRHNGSRVNFPKLSKPIHLDRGFFNSSRD